MSSEIAITGSAPVVAGSPEEAALAADIAQTFRGLGLEVRIEGFPVRAYRYAEPKLLANGKPYRAISLLSGAIGREDRAVFHALRAEAYNSIGGYDKARADARMALAQSPGLQEAVLQLAISEQGLGLVDSAVIRYRQVLSTKPGTNTRYRLATALQAKKDPTAALAELDGVLGALPEGDPALPKVLRSKAECLALTGDTAGARTTFTRALELAPLDPVTLNSRGWFLYAVNGDHVRAIADYAKAIKQNPNYSFAFNNRGWSRYKNGDTQGALKDINLARSKRPDNPYIYRNLGIIALDGKDLAAACAHFQKALDLGFTGLHGDEVERLAKEHCPSLSPPPPPVAPKDPDPRPAPPSRSNAPE